MAGASSGDGGGRRHLPSWMLCSTDQEKKSSGAEENRRDEAKNRQRNTSTAEEKPKKKRGSKKSNQEEPGDPIAVPRISSVKGERSTRGKVVREPFRRKRKNARSGGSTGNDSVEIRSPIDEDEDLTVEDLDAIAKEYVYAGEEAKILRTIPTSDHRRGSEPSRTAKSESERRDSVMASDNGLGPSVYDRNCNSLIGEERVTHLGVSSGDPAQDMLDLFLGPLLKKAAEPEKKPFNVVPMDPGTGKEMRDCESREVMAEVKKKISLKDRVSAFLD